MNVYARRALGLVGAGALGLVASAALLATGGPAYAADGGGDLEVSVSATTFVAGSSPKDFTMTVVNRGPDGAIWSLEYDFSGLDDSMVKVESPTLLGCTRTDDKLTCQEGGLSVGHSYWQHNSFELVPVPGAKGEAGSFTVAAVSDTDPNPGNNTATVKVDVPAKGVDLVTLAEDVFQVADDGEPTDEPVAPGGSSFVLGAVGNIGDTIAEGLKVSVALPRYVTFGEAERGCTYGADNRTATCAYEDITLVPIDRDTSESDNIISVVGIVFPVTVAKDAPGPVVLDGGVLSGYALKAEDEVSTAVLARSATAELPKGLKTLSAEDVKDVKDANVTDNTDQFKVHVGAAATGSEGSAGGEAPGGDQPGGTGGGLPVTGVQAGLLGGVGAGVMVLGAALFLVSRRRRVVLTTPDDEVPTA
ncbi:hypothetical protein EAD89_02025 [Micromonospora sp. BL4]|uniref:hypothetical protein n=1 Tax=Micromonospora sp. BL4 TaxID=2478710 RepID=UPI000EF5F89E|nr:hypothetical protein [Micromonospora sp. BL4]RLP95235.1 hypothetical protein EAD89_02025 [Micromonospora sp. BL4]